MLVSARQALMLFTFRRSHSSLPALKTKRRNTRDRKLLNQTFWIMLDFFLHGGVFVLFSVLFASVAGLAFVTVVRKYVRFHFSSLGSDPLRPNRRMFFPRKHYFPVVGSCSTTALLGCLWSQHHHVGYWWKEGANVAAPGPSVCNGVLSFLHIL